MNKPLTAEEARNLQFPCLLEAWNNVRSGHHTVVVGVTEIGRFKAITGFHFKHAAIPPTEITEAMRKQFGIKSEYPKRMLVWDVEESKAQPRIVIADLGKKASSRYIVVRSGCESKYENGEGFSCNRYNHAKPIPEPDPIAQEIAEIRQRLADLEAKHNQQSK